MLTSFPMENTSLTCLQVYLGNSHFWVGDSFFRHVTSRKYKQRKHNGQPVKDKNGGPVKEKQPVDIKFNSWTFCSTSESTCIEIVVTYLKSTRYKEHFIPLLVLVEKLNENVLLYLIPYCGFLAFLDIYERCLSFFSQHYRI